VEVGLGLRLGLRRARRMLEILRVRRSKCY